MQSSSLERHLKLRVLSSILDLILFIIILIGTYLFFMFLFPSLNYSYILFYILLFFFVYYSLIPKLTGGYTIAGILFGMRIIKKNTTKIKLLEYFLRSLYGIFSYFVNFGYVALKTNELGQFYFDIPFNILVISKFYPIKDKDTCCQKEEFYFYFLSS